MGWHGEDKKGMHPKHRLKHTEGEVRDKKLDNTSIHCPVRTDMFFIIITPGFLY